MSQWQHPQALDRCEGRRSDPSWVEECWRLPGARVIGVDSQGRVDVDQGGLRFAPASGLYDPSRHYLLGILGGLPLFAVAVPRAAFGLRTLLDDLPQAELAVAFVAVGLVGWHSRSGFCGRCGTASIPALGGLMRTCPSCGLDDYPRSDPAVIVAITDADGRLLLARQPSWAPGRYSVLAGFCEVGESLEQTVHREIAEEVGIRVADVCYLGSQPWPFPRSLMAAYRARAQDRDLTPADGEIEQAAWFTADELRAALRDGSVSLPSPASIARRMIEAWLDGELAALRVG